MSFDKKSEVKRSVKTQSVTALKYVLKERLRKEEYSLTKSSKMKLTRTYWRIS